MNKREIVDQLLNYLLQENPNLVSISIPEDEKQRRDLLTSLINVRSPKKIPEDILALEDQLLQLELAEQTITHVKDIPEVAAKIGIWKGDITTLDIEAIVNAGNSYLLGCFIPHHFCIDHAIHTKAGMRLRLACADIMKGKEANTAEVIVTKAYNLPSQYVLHTVGPIVDGSLKQQDIDELVACYRNCLDIAHQHNIRTIAFPAISTGLFKFPKDKASQIAVETVREYVKKDPAAFDKIIFNVFTKEDQDYYERLF